jgi:O-methyltransferase involved in polyketide biosynthesis
MPASSVTDMALRAKKLDDVVRRFVTNHDNAVVLDLGAGLDSRFNRVTPPATVDWYDIDFPAVISLPRQVLPPSPAVHPVAAMLTDAGWLDEIPADRPPLSWPTAWWRSLLRTRSCPCCAGSSHTSHSAKSPSTATRVSTPGY